MSDVISRHVEFLAHGMTRTTIVWVSGTRLTTISYPEIAARPAPPTGPRYQPGNAGYRRAMRTIDARVENGVITAEEGRQMEEDYITRSDREERL
jgi:hypothetical protein